MLDWTLLGNTGGAWLLALALGAGSLAAMRIVLLVLTRRLGARADAKAAALTEPDGVQEALLLNLLRSTKSFFLLLLAIYFGTRWLVLPENVLSVIRYATTAAIAVQVGLWGNVLISLAVNRSVRKRVEEDAAAATTVNVLGYVGRVALWSVIALMALANLGHEITPLLAGLGVGGIAVALAVQNVLADLFASLSIVLDKPFVIGDFLIVGEMLGTVEYIGLKTTRVRSLSGEQLVFSNSDLLNSRIRNFKRMYERRVVFTIGVTYQTPYDKLAAIPGMIREIVAAQQNTRFDRAHFWRYGDFSLDFEIVYHVLVPDYNVYMDIQQAINLEIFRRFEAEDIEFAYPTRTLYVHPAESAEGEAAAAGRVPAGGTR